MTQNPKPFSIFLSNLGQSKAQISQHNNNSTNHQNIKFEVLNILFVNDSIQIINPNLITLPNSQTIEENGYRNYLRSSKMRETMTTTAGRHVARRKLVGRTEQRKGSWEKWPDDVGKENSSRKYKKGWSFTFPCHRSLLARRKNSPESTQNATSCSLSQSRAWMRNKERRRRRKKGTHSGFWVPQCSPSRRRRRHLKEERWKTEGGREWEKRKGIMCVCREGEGSAPPHLRPPEFARRAEERKREVGWEKEEGVRFI